MKKTEERINYAWTGKSIGGYAKLAVHNADGRPVGIQMQRHTLIVTTSGAQSSRDHTALSARGHTPTRQVPHVQPAAMHAEPTSSREPRPMTRPKDMSLQESLPWRCASQSSESTRHLGSSQFLLRCHSPHQYRCLDHHSQLVKQLGENIHMRNQENPAGIQREPTNRVGTGDWRSGITRTVLERA